MVKGPNATGENPKAQIKRPCPACGSETEAFNWKCPQCGYSLASRMHSLSMMFATSWLVFTNILYFTFYMM